MVIFKSKQIKFECDLKINLFGKRLYPAESVRYLGVKFDTSLSWHDIHVNDLSVKQNRINVFLFKMRKYASHKMLRFIYFTAFDLPLCCQGSKIIGTIQ